MTTRKTPFAFISYRRDDSRDWAGLLANTLRRAFGPQAVFLDTDSIRVGHRWPATIDEALERATVILPVIGSQWLSLQTQSDGRRRIDAPNDWVRREVEAGLTPGRTLLPVLTLGTKMPTAEQLPLSISSLTQIEAESLREQADANRIMTRLTTREFGFRSIDTPFDFPVPFDTMEELCPKEQERLRTCLPDWRIIVRDHPRGHEGTSTELERLFKFSSFLDAMHFMVATSRYIDRSAHHPQWENLYQEVRVTLTSWDVGHRLTAKDARLAEYLEKSYAEYMANPADVGSVPRSRSHTVMRLTPP
jgi:pterin-4a-carbinolamine dehydratase